MHDILCEIKRKDSHFVCHKSLPANRDRIASDVTCRGYWDVMLQGKAHPGQLVRIATRLRYIQYVEVE